ncbi:MAG: metallophosphoesterase [Methylohalobius sp.]|nr:metallophosphoesterase [Methylohalobius sp.]
MDSPPSESALYRLLEARLGRAHLNQRLGMEQDFERRVFGGLGRNFFHLENWYSVHGLIRAALRLCGLHSRGRRNARKIQVVRTEVFLPHLPLEFEGFTLLHLSDLHLDLSDDLPAALIAAVQGLDYDVCVLTGDFRGRTFGPWQAAVEALAEVRPHLKAPCYGVLGNHDTVRMVPSLEAMDIRMLMNEAVTLRRGAAEIYLAGIDDPHYYRADNLEKAVETIPEEAVTILLAHSPEIYRNAAYARCDLLLCGHTHGGQICLPGGFPLMRNAKAPYALCSGRWRYAGLQGYTSRGCGVSVVDVRLNCPPEVTLHVLRRSQ